MTNGILVLDSFSCEINGFGVSLSLNYDGQVLAVGVPYGYDNNDDALPGHVDVYNVGAGLTKIGETLDGECPMYGCFCDCDGCVSDFFGVSVSLSKDGTVLAVGAPGHEYFAGKVEVFRWTGTEWVLHGQPIIGPVSGDSDSVGIDVDLDADGNTVAVGSESYLFSHDDHDHFSDVATVYYLLETGWAQLGRQFVGRDISTSFLALSDNGRVLAASAFDDSVVRRFNCITGCY